MMALLFVCYSLYFKIRSYLLLIRFYKIQSNYNIEKIVVDIVSSFNYSPIYLLVQEHFLHQLQLLKIFLVWLQRWYLC